MTKVRLGLQEKSYKWDYMSRLNWQFLPYFERISYKNPVHSNKLTSTQSSLW